MPALSNQRHEAFARARSRGANRTVAHTLAGYAPSRGAGSRMGKRDDIKTRVAELVKEDEAIREASLEETIVALLMLAKSTDAPNTAAGLKEARLARLDAWRLCGLRAARDGEAAITPPRAMTEAEWDAKYGPDAPASR
jgi:hypothetical protein